VERNDPFLISKHKKYQGLKEKRNETEKFRNETKRMKTKNFDKRNETEKK
jgi:hypothetical protein